MYIINEFKALDGTRRYGIYKKDVLPKNLIGIASEHWVSIKTYKNKACAEKKLRELQNKHK